MIKENIKLQEVKEERKHLLGTWIDYLKKKIDKQEDIHLNFICTHNSRRSQFAQFWSDYYSWKFQLNIKSYSGGTEVTACHPNTISALKRLGFTIEMKTAESNPHYLIQLGMDHTIELFSKLHTESIISPEPFAALMCCSDAAENCPFVAGTETTISLNYTDPKWADGSEEEDEAYDKCCLQIASEIHYIFAQIKISK